MNEAFLSSKAALVGATMLSHSSPGATISLTSDASDRAVKAVNNSWQLLAFFRKQLRPPEQKNSTFDKRTSGTVPSSSTLPILFGCPFTIFTDHNPLVGGMSQVSDLWTARQQQHLAHVSEFSTDMRLISGKANIVADCLSRTVPINNVVLSIDYEAMAKEQAQNAEVHTFHTAVTGLKVVSILCHNTGPDLLCDVSIGNPKPNVPFQHHIFKTIHNLAHSGQKSTIKLVLQKFVWHSLKKS